MNTGYTLSFDIDYDDARPYTVDTLEVSITEEEYAAVKALGRKDYYELPESVQGKVDDAFFKWNRRRGGGYSIGAVDVWKN
ncbi:MAG: hypothetical protein Q4G10_09395 [Bacteroidia bacterium]|nr:hypothetical protein [Bacteroidia bacterium]